MGVTLSEPIKDKEYDEDRNVKFEFCAASMQGWRTSMEDAHIADIKIDNDTGIFGVFDGHGGAEVAKYVKNHFVEELKKNQNFKNRKNLDIALRETFIQMDRLMLTKEGTRELFSYSPPTNTAASTPSTSTQKDQEITSLSAGCTANVALFYKNQLVVANSGDSRSVLCSKGQPFEMSKDHKPENPEELSRIKNAGGYVADGRVNGNLNLSRAMGDFEYKNLEHSNQQHIYPKDPEKCMITVVPETKQKMLVATDKFLLMGCDGIWECKTNDELMNYIKFRIDEKNMPLKEILTELLEEIVAKDPSQGIGCDNMTAIIIVIKKIQ